MREDPATIFLGDIHGDFRWLAKIIELDPNIEHIVQLGDFGYWEHTKVGVDFLDGVSALCVENDIRLDFLDGNHENHEMLVTYNDNRSYGVDPVEVRPNLRWLPRGSELTLSDGRRVFVCGGAPSVDRAYRKLGEDWWPGEVISREDFDFCMERLNKPYDLFISHDAPADHSLWEILGGRKGFPTTKKMNDDCLKHRQMLSDLWAASGAPILVHGHYHQQSVRVNGPRKVIGLSQERTNGSFKYSERI